MTAEQEKLLIDVHTYVGSEVGRRRVAEALQRRRLPGYMDVDIETAVLEEARKFLERGETMNSVAGWCNARIGARAIDLARGAIRREREMGRTVSVETIVEEAVDTTELVVPAGELNTMRRLILDGAADAHAKAGALTFINRVAEKVDLCPECPQPKTGADESETAIWAALWYLGHRDCFESGNTAAKRRSRAAAGVRAALRSMAERIARP
jgi:hypothetical protein